MSGFCRECLEDVPDRAARCPACGSPRLVRHGELDRLAIAHVDCDAFYANVEKRDAPALRDKPVIVGGRHRGVVLAACYVARIYGVRSAMPMFKALELCPDAVVVPPNMEKYVGVGREVRALMQALTPQVEPLSIDEAFLDLAGTEKLHGMPPALVLARFAQTVEKELGITVSAGLSYCKFLAKVASDLNKPRGFSVIGAQEAVFRFEALALAQSLRKLNLSFQDREQARHLARELIRRQKRGKTRGQKRRMVEGKKASRTNQVGVRMRFR